MTKRAEMRKVVVGAFLSLDDIMQSPGTMQKLTGGGLRSTLPPPPSQTKI